MAKKKISTQKKGLEARLPAQRKYINAGALVLITALVLGAGVGPWRNTLEAKKLRAFLATAPPSPPPSNLSKEYIYAGGRLIATEEPPAQPTLPAPTGLVANTVSGTQINLNWIASPGADHYQLERTAKISEPYTIVSSSITTTSFSDTVGSSSAYLYRVVAVGSSGNISPPSNIDLATAVGFTDDPLTVGTLIKELHVSQLREAVAMVRVTANLSTVTWTDSPLTIGTPIKAVHVQELQTNLNQARSGVGLPACSFTPPTAGSLILKEHLNQLRECVK